MKHFSIAFIVVLLTLTTLQAEAIEYAGMIVNDVERPCAGATVTVRSLDNPSDIFTALTDTTGLFFFDVTGVEDLREAPFSLHGNFPNPFNPTTRISYSLDKASEVTLAIYNVLGQHVRSLDHGYREAGFYTTVWDGRDENGLVSSAGVYLYRLRAGNRFLTSKMLMVDAATGMAITPRQASREAFKSASEGLYTVTVTHRDAATLTLGPMSLNGTADTTLMLERDLRKMELVSKNQYNRGTNKRQYPYVFPEHPVFISHDFYMDKYEVTVQQFCDVMNSALSRGALKVDGRMVSSVEGDHRELFLVKSPEELSNVKVIYDGERFTPEEEDEKIPANFMNWYGAMFYCYERNLIEGLEQAVLVEDWTFNLKADGYRLPTDAEWELAAKWTDGRDYAFGRDPGHYKPINVQLNDDNFDDTLSPVGWFSPQGDSHDGICDLSGNVYEWCLDWQGDYTSATKDVAQIDPVNPNVGVNKICRGGSAMGCFRSARTFDKANIRIEDTRENIGIRTIRPVVE